MRADPAGVMSRVLVCGPSLGEKIKNLRRHNRSSSLAATYGSNGSGGVSLLYTLCTEVVVQCLHLRNAVRDERAGSSQAG
eukprot:678803-Prymnesium_polylepis.2